MAIVDPMPTDSTSGSEPGRAGPSHAEPRSVVERSFGVAWMHSRRRFASVAWLAAALAASVAAGVSSTLSDTVWADGLTLSGTGETPRGTFFQSLRDRQLFGLAETYAEQRLAAARLTPELRTELVLELAKTRGEHALGLDPEQAAELFALADADLGRELEAQRDPAARRLLLGQRALLASRRGEQAIWQDRCQGGSGRNQASGSKLATELESVATGIGQAISEIKLDPREKTSAGGRAMLAVKALTQTLRIRRAEIQQELALALPEGSAQAADLLIEADRELRAVLGEALAAPVQFSARLGVIRGLWMRGEWTPSLTAWDMLSADVADSDRLRRAQLAVEKARLQLARGQPADAARWLIRQRTDGGLADGELAWWQLRSLVELRAVTAARQDPKLLSDIDREAAALIQRISESHGQPWSRRAAMLWLNGRLTAGLPPELVELRQQAMTATSRQDWVAAAGAWEALLDAGGEQLEGLVRDEARWELGQSSLRAELWRQAATAFAEVATEPVTEPAVEQGASGNDPERRAQAAVYRVYALGRLAEVDANESNVSEYRTSLAELGRSQPGHVLVILWQGRDAELQGDRQLAVNLYQQIPADSPQADAALAGIARCLLQQIQATPAPTGLAPEFMDSAQQLEQRLLGQPNAAAALAAGTITAAQGEVWLLVLQLRHQLPGRSTGDDDRWLQQLAELAVHRAAAEETADHSATGWQSLAVSAISERLRHWAQRRQVPQADAWFEQLGPDLRIVLRPLIRQLTERFAPVENAAPPTAAQSESRELAAVVLACLPRWRQLSAASPSVAGEAGTTIAAAFDWLEARALAATGESARALATYRQLARTIAKDSRQLDELLGDLESLADPAAGPERLKLARLAEARQTAGTTEWWSARVRVVRALQSQGQVAEARKLMLLTRRLYPQLAAQPAIDEQLRELEERLK